MKLHIALGRFELLFVLGRVYLVAQDAHQSSCLRMAWAGSPVLRWGPRPVAAG